MPVRFREAFPDRQLIVVSNREPYEHRWVQEMGELEVIRPAGGLTSALDPVLQALGGTWIAWGSGDGDAEVVDEHDRVRVPPEAPSYTLRRLWLDQRDIHHYYLGFSNQFLWPLCHLRPALTRIRRRHWERYGDVNRRFAEAVLEEAAGQRAAVWFHDYHLALAPAHVRARRPELTLAHFWHIPWPPVEVYRIATQGAELLRGLLANDLMGFQVRPFADNFLRCAQTMAGAEVDWDRSTATLDGHTCHVRAFPISIDVDAYVEAATRPGIDAQLARLKRRFTGVGGQVGIGVDRLDYSKGLPERLKALDLMWLQYPELRERFTFLQVAVPSRTDIEAYDELSHKVERLVWQINDRFGTGIWQPIHLLKEHLPASRLAVLYRMADVCVVSSLQDGMNLVAKEYVASQVDGTGVLLLSLFTGASEEMDGAIDVNPYDPENLAERLREALEMPVEERKKRMRRLKASLRTIYDWMAEIFATWGRLAASQPGGGQT